MARWLGLSADAFALAALATLAAACGSAAARSQTGSSTSGAGGAGGSPPIGGGGSGVTPDAAPEAAVDSPYCGTEFHKVTGDPPNLYFLFDVSASMGDMAEGGLTKWEIVQNSAVTMVETLGTLINFGAATFPGGAVNVDPCDVGQEVFPVTPGNPRSPMIGPNTANFVQQISLPTGGGTPTASTLRALTPELSGLHGRTIVLLSTDGGPNCNPKLTCSASQCVPNIEANCSPPGANCCASGGSTGPTGCLDEDATVAAVAALAAAKVPVVVIGIPGSAVYSSTLDAMAQAGGAPQANGPPYYYRIDDLGQLTDTFLAIGQSYVSCDVTLDPVPADMTHTNVYFDGVLVPADPQNGWVWKSAAQIELVGSACTELKTGVVREVEVVSGCATQTG